MAEEIFPGVYGISLQMGYVNTFLVAAEDGLTLVDTGLADKREAILKAVHSIGRQPTDIKHILITHHHIDHTGSLADLKDATHAKAYVHPLDSPVVRGEQPVPGPNPKSRLGKVLWPVMGRFAKTLATTEVDVEVSDGDVLPVAGGMKVVHTPGHTAGHVCYLWPTKRILFVGDAAGHMLRLGLPFGMFTEDMEQAKESIRKLAALEFDIACFGHGSVLKGEANLAFRRLAEKLAR